MVLKPSSTSAISSTGLGIGDWGLGVLLSNTQSPIPGRCAESALAHICGSSCPAGDKDSAVRFQVSGIRVSSFVFRLLHRSSFSVQRWSLVVGHSSHSNLFELLCGGKAVFRAGLGHPLPHTILPTLVFIELRVVLLECGNLLLHEVGHILAMIGLLRCP